MWNATPFFNNALDLEKPRYRYSTLGANLGGPVPLKTFRDNMFFFYAYEHLRITTTDGQDIWGGGDGGWIGRTGDPNLQLGLRVNF